MHTRRIIDPSGGVKLTGSSGRQSFAFLSSADTSPRGEAQRFFTIGRTVEHGGKKTPVAPERLVDELSDFEIVVIDNASSAAERERLAREAPGRIPFLVKDPRGHADFYAALARHDAKGSANTMRSFQGGRPSIYTMTDAIRKVPTPALILCGDEDDNCVGPSLFLKQHLPAAGLSFFPKSGHVLNLEEPALFNEMVERFIALAGQERIVYDQNLAFVEEESARHKRKGGESDE